GTRFLCQTLSGAPTLVIEGDHRFHVFWSSCLNFGAFLEEFQSGRPEVFLNLFTLRFSFIRITNPFHFSDVTLVQLSQALAQCVSHFGGLISGVPGFEQMTSGLLVITEEEISAAERVISRTMTWIACLFDPVGNQREPLPDLFAFLSNIVQGFSIGISQQSL